MSSTMISRMTLTYISIGSVGLQEQEQMARQSHLCQRREQQTWIAYLHRPRFQYASLMMRWALQFLWRSHGHLVEEGTGVGNIMVEGMETAVMVEGMAAVEAEAMVAIVGAAMA